MDTIDNLRKKKDTAGADRTACPGTERTACIGKSHTARTGESHTACTGESRWSLFLDRDGVINERIIDVYIKDFTDFKFKKDFIEIFPKIANLFDYIFIVTNQQGIGKGLMTTHDLETVHSKMLSKLNSISGKVDKIYFCPHLKEENCRCRKPNPGMAYMAKIDFPAIDFKKSILIGDGEGDIGFGKNAGMKTIFINNNSNKQAEADYSVKDFYEIENIIQRLLK